MDDKDPLDNPRLSERTKQEIAEGQRLLAMRAIAREFNPEYKTPWFEKPEG